MSHPARPAAPAPDPELPPVPQGRISFDEYMAFEEAHPERHEYIDGYVYAMSGGSTPHGQIATNVSGHLWTAARGGPCGVYAHDVKLRIGDRVFYPDVMAVCDPKGVDRRMAYAPCLLVEVLSESTGVEDRTTKLAAYTSIPALQAYWIVSQTWRSVERHWRGADGLWGVEQVEGDGALDAPCPARPALTLDEVYEGLDLPRTPPGGPPLRRVYEILAEYADVEA